MRTGVSWRLKVAERGAQAADGCVDAASKQNDRQRKGADGDNAGAVTRCK
jgi:hypothetical protein